MRKMNSLIPVLMYHIISDLASANDVYTVATDAFDTQMKFLSESGFRILTVNEVADKVGFDDHPIVVITFDDGHISNYTRAFPILRKYGFKAVFFVTTKHIGESGYVSWDNLREMAAAGMIIGSHSVNHPILTKLSAEQLNFEMVESRKVLEQGLGMRVDLFSNPHIFTNKVVQSAAFAAGYKLVCVSNAGYYTANSGRKVLGRINIRNDYNLSDFKAIAQCDKGFLIKIIFQRAITSAVRSLVGMDRYEKVKRIIMRFLLKR
jgi:peptidoglycan/xylan/chitin deacetylase (PgdA/CDA1 family)